MILNLIVVALVLSITAAWIFRGAFNSLIHLLCVLTAGAVAFGLWEPLSMMIVGFSPERGFFSFIEGLAWGVGLILPFVVTLIVLRVITDKVVKGNIKNWGMVDVIFGFLFGFQTAMITAGIFVIALGAMRLPSNFLGYQPLWYSEDRAAGQGALVRTDTLWIPVDRLVSMSYGGLSQGTLSTSQPLAKWYPDLDIARFGNRISAGDGGARNTYTDDAFRLTSAYTIGSIDGSTPVEDLLKDKRDPIAQGYLDIDSKKIDEGYLAGFVVNFAPNARERGKKGGQVMVSNGQIRLVAQNKDGDTLAMHPVATISESIDGPDGRWRFDSNDVFINSVGGKTAVPMGFEFLVPADYTPIGLSIKGVRINLEESSMKIAEISSVADRDRRIRSGSLLKGDAPKATFNMSDVKVVDGSANVVQGVLIGNSLRNMMSTTTAKSQGFTLDDNLLSEGQGKFDVKAQLGRNNTPTDRRLRVDKFSLGKRQQMVQIDVSPDMPASLLDGAMRLTDTDKPIKLIDTKGGEYEAIGFVYQDEKIMEIRYTNGSTLKGLTDMPSLSTSRIGDQKLRILFIVTQNVEIEYLVVGDDAILHFKPKMPTKRR
ncbi:MAG: CvpA family protein [Phycisphaerales bacterium]|nr:CvpA family protein [Phycisphaerales bacterium]